MYHLPTMPEVANWDKRSKAGVASGGVNGEEARGEGFLQWTESHFSLLHAASAVWDQLDDIAFVSYVLHHTAIVTGAAVPQKNFLCSV